MRLSVKSAKEIFSWVRGPLRSRLVRQLRHWINLYLYDLIIYFLNNTQFFKTTEHYDTRSKNNTQIRDLLNLTCSISAADSMLD